MKKAQDRTIRLILGLILVLIALPALGMGIAGMSSYGMMGMVYGGLGVFWFLAALGVLILGIYLIFDGLKR